MLRPAVVACSEVSRGTVLDRCTLHVPVGRRLLVVSEPDGAASALLRVLAGLSRPRTGRVELAGLGGPSREGWGDRVSYLGPEPGIHPWMTPREAIALAAELLGLPEAEATRRARRALAWCHIDDEAARRPVRRGGPALAQRTGLASALMADPEVLLLDEPLRALDAHERARLLRLPGRRRTVVLASRYPASEAGIVTHLALLRGGRVVLECPVAELPNEGADLSMTAILAHAERSRTAAAPDVLAEPAAAAR